MKNKKMSAASNKPHPISGKKDDEKIKKNSEFSASSTSPSSFSDQYKKIHNPSSQAGESIKSKLRNK